MGSCCSLPRTRHSCDRVAEGPFFFLHLRACAPVAGDSAAPMSLCCSLPRTPVIRLQRASFGIRACSPAVGDSAEAVGLCRSLPRAQRSRYNWIAENRFLHLRACAPAVEIPQQLWVCAAASRARGRRSYAFVLQPPVIIGLRRIGFGISACAPAVEIPPQL